MASWSNLKGLLCLAARCVAGLAPCSTFAQSEQPLLLDLYTAPQLVVTIPGDRKINLVCSGEGSPTVILTAGLGGWSANWFKVQPGIAEKTRVCSWDRAGFGFSEPRVEPLDIARSSKDLEQALAAAGIEGPFVLVGHSLGGLETLLFADGHRDELAGIVLVDPTIPGQFQRFARIAPHFTAESARGRTASHSTARDCVDALQATGARRPLPPGCPPAILPSYPAAIVLALTPLQADPMRVLTQSSMVQEMYRSTELGLNPGRNYGDIPLIVLSAPADDPTVPPGVPTAFSFAPNTDQRILNEVPLLARELSAGHDELAQLSSEGSKREILGVGHMIPVIRPEVVVMAVDEVVERARKGA